jgi:hypothetical protein
MKKLLLIIILIFSFICGACQDKKPVTKKIQKKTGLETNSATSTEVDTLNQKIDKLTDDIK